MSISDADMRAFTEFAKAQPPGLTPSQLTERREINQQQKETAQSIAESLAEIAAGKPELFEASQQKFCQAQGFNLPD